MGFIKVRKFKPQSQDNILFSATNSLSTACK